MKIKKRIVSLLLAVLTLAALLPGAFADNTVTASNPAQVLDLALRSGYGPLTIARTELHRGRGTEEVYLIAVSGAKLSLSRANSYPAFIISALSLPSACLAMVIDAVKKTVPAGSKIMLIGHSVGGNIVQQFAAELGMRKRYEIINTVTCGSPLVLTLGCEGGLHRLCDLRDPIPMLSLATALNLFVCANYGVSGSFLLNPHAESYYREDIWGGYDCLGVKGGNAYLTCDMGSLVAFPLTLFPF